VPRGCLKILCRFSFCADYISLHLTYPPIKTPVTTRPRSRSVWGWGFAARAFQNHLLTWQARAFQRDSKGIYRIQAHLPSPFLLLSRSGCKRVRWLQFLPVYQKITSSSCRLRRGGWRFQRHCCLEKVVHRHSQVLQRAACLWPLIRCSPQCQNVQVNVQVGNYAGGIPKQKNPLTREN